MAGKARYRTRQRELVAACLAAHAGSYLSVDEALADIVSKGESIGRTTVYRTLEAMAAEGLALKATVPGSDTSYRIASDGAAGQLVCLVCGTVAPLDCGMAGDLAEHVLKHHSFKVDSTRTVLYGLCQHCAEAQDGR